MVGWGLGLGVRLYNRFCHPSCARSVCDGMTALKWAAPCDWPSCAPRPPRHQCRMLTWGGDWLSINTVSPGRFTLARSTCPCAKTAWHNLRVFPIKRIWPALRRLLEGGEGAVPYFSRVGLAGVTHWAKSQLQWYDVQKRLQRLSAEFNVCVEFAFPKSIWLLTAI